MSSHESSNEAVEPADDTRNAPPENIIESSNDAQESSIDGQPETSKRDEEETPNDIDNRERKIDDNAEKEESAETYESASKDEDDALDMDQELHKLSKHRRKAPAKADRGSQERRRTSQRKAGQGKTISLTAEELELGDGEEVLDEATKERRALEARIDAVLQPSSKRRKKLAGDDLEVLQDEAIARMRDSMREAALQDVECIKQGLPAIHKVKALPEAVQMLRKNQLADAILDGNLLESVRIWLEPLPDASLPSFEIQKAMFDALMTLPIKTIHLRESGLGRVVLFYQKSKRPQAIIKRMAQKLIGDWTRPIIGRSDNYRDKQVATANYDPSDSHWSASSQSSAPTLYEESAARRGRAAIPSASGVSYRVAPVSEVMLDNANSSSSQPKDSQLRRMKTKLMASGRSGRSGRKSQVSVEGRGLN